MKKVISIFLNLIIIIAFVPNVLSFDVEYLKNRSFENGTTGYIAANSGSHTAGITNQASHSGDNSYFMTTTTNVRVVLYQVVSGLVEGEEYTFSAYVNANSSSTRGARLRVMAGDGVWGEIASNPTFVTNTNSKWEKIELKFTMPKNLTKIQLKVRWDGTGTVYWDDVSLYGLASEAGEPIPSDNIKETYLGKSEVFTNNGFENVTGTRPVDWGFYNNSVVSASTEKALSGIYSVKIQTDNSSDNPWVRQIISDVEPGATYQVSAWINSSNISDAGTVFKFEFYSNTEATAGYGLGVDFITDPFPVTNGRWLQVESTFKAPENCRGMKLYFRLLGTGTVFYDDVSCRIVEKVPTHFLETNEIFYYSDLSYGTAYISANTKSYPNILNSKVDIKLKDGNKILNQSLDNSFSTGKINYQIDLSYLTEKKKEYILEVSTKDASGNILYTATERIHKYDRPKALTKEGIYKVNGETFNPIFGYHVYENQYPLCKEAGVNVVQTWIANNKPATIVQKLDLIASYNLKAIVTLYLNMKPAGHSINEANTKAVIELVKNHPAVFAYAVQDEPFLNSSIEEDLRNSYKIIREIDDVHPVYMVDASSQTNKLTGKYTDILCIDPYPGSGNNPHTFVADETKVAVSLFGDRKPIYVIMQAFKYKDYWPTTNEFRNMHYQAYLEGAKGIGYYAFDASYNGKLLTENELWDTMTSFYNKESANFFDFSSYGDIIEEYKGNDYWYRLINKNNELYIAVLNREKIQKSININLDIEPGHMVELLNGTNISNLSYSDSNLSLNLEPSSAVLMKVVPENLISFSNGFNIGYGFISEGTIVIKSTAPSNYKAMVALYKEEDGIKKLVDFYYLQDSETNIEILNIEDNNYILKAYVWNSYFSLKSKSQFKAITN